MEHPALLAGANYLQHLVVAADPRRFHDNAADAVGRAPDGGAAFDRLVAATSRSSGHRTAGRLLEARRYATEGRRILDELTDVERAPLRDTLPHLLVQWGLAHQFADVGGERTFEEAYELASLTGQPAIARRAAALLAWLHADRGQLHEAERWIARAAASGVPAPRYDAPLHLASALVGNDRLDTAATTGALAALDEVDLGEHWAAALWVHAWAARTADEAVLLQQRLEAELARTTPAVATGGANRRYLLAASAQLATLQGLPLDAGDAVRFALDDTDPFDAVMAAASAYRAGDARELLRHAATATGGRSPRMRAGAQLLVAAARQLMKAPDAAADAFRLAHAVIEAEGLNASYGILTPTHREALFELTGLHSPAIRLLGAVGEQAPPTPTDALASLTPRQRDVLILLAQGRTGTEISRELFVSPNTVKTITAHLYRKLGVHTRAEAAGIAFRAGLA